VELVNFKIFDRFIGVIDFFKLDSISSGTKNYSSVEIILWTMRKNNISKRFYLRFGFKENSKSRISKRNKESFEEIQFELKKENAI